MKLMPTSNLRLSQNRLGRMMTPSPARAAWKHPWFTELLWLPMLGAWVAYVTPGFVNGNAPTVRTTASAVRESRGAFFGQLVDARSGADEIEQLARLAIGEEFQGLPSNTRIDVPLYERPPVGLNQWRKLGWDGEGRVPAFFKALGVAEPPVSAASQLIAGGPINLASTTPPKGNRLLRACDIFLIQPRTALTSEIEVTPSGFVSGTGLVNQTLGFRSPGPEDRLRIVSGTYNPQSNVNLNFAQRNPNLVASDYEEKTWDEILISTVYLLSPPNAQLDSEPGSDWQVYVQHNTFWNLSWAQPRIRPVFNTDIFRPLVALTGILAGGAGVGSVSWLASSINDATQGAFNILQAQSLAGSFWTATGGGTVGYVPPPKPADTKTGVDKAAAAAARRRAEESERNALRLEPPFPYQGIKFNSSLLS